MKQNKQEQVAQIVKEIMQAGFDVSMGGNPDESEEWNKLWGKKEYDLLVAEYTNKLSDLLSQTRQEAVEDERERIIDEFGSFRKLDGKRYSKTLRFYLAPHTKHIKGDDDSTM